MTRTGKEKRATTCTRLPFPTINAENDRMVQAVARFISNPGGGLFSTPSCPGSIVGAAAFHFRVRDENGWDRCALTTKALSIPRIRNHCKPPIITGPITAN